MTLRSRGMGRASRPAVRTPAPPAAALAVLALACACSRDPQGSVATGPDLAIDFANHGDTPRDFAVLLDLSLPPLDMAKVSLCGAGSGVQAGSPWPMRGCCPSRRGWSPYIGPES